MLFRQPQPQLQMSMLEQGPSRLKNGRKSLVKLCGHAPGCPEPDIYAIGPTAPCRPANGKWQRRRCTRDRMYVAGPGKPKVQQR